MQTYIFYDNLLYKLQDDNTIEILESFELIENNSKIIYIPNSWEIIKKENELYYYIKEHYPILEELEGKYAHISKFNGEFYVSEYNEILLKNRDLMEQKKIKIVNVIDYISKIYSNNKKGFFTEEDISNLIVLPLSNYFFNVLIENVENKPKLKKIDLIDNRDIQEHISNLVFAEQKNDKILVLNTNDELKESEEYEDIKKLFHVSQFESYFEDNPLFQNLKNKLGEYFIQFNINISNCMLFFIREKVKTKEIRLDKYYSKVKKQTNIKFGIIGMVILLFGGINYWINNVQREEIINDFENKIYELRRKYNKLKQKKLKEKANRIHSIITKKFSKADKEFLTLPYLITYLSHFKLKINSAELIFDEKNVKYYGFVTVTGMLPNSLLIDFSKTIGLEGLDMIPTKNVMNNGFTYILTFDMSKVYKILKEKGLINVTNF